MNLYFVETLQLKKDKMKEERRINEELASLLQELGDLKVKYREEKERNDIIEHVSRQF